MLGDEGGGDLSADAVLSRLCLTAESGGGEQGGHKYGIRESGFGCRKREILELIRSVVLAIGFLVMAPFLGVAGAFSHDARYEEDLSDEW